MSEAGSGRAFPLTEGKCAGPALLPPCPLSRVPIVGAYYQGLRGPVARGMPPRRRWVDLGSERVGNTGEEIERDFRPRMLKTGSGPCGLDSVFHTRAPIQGSMAQAASVT